MTHTDTDALDAALRALDAASVTLTPEQEARRDALRGALLADPGPRAADADPGPWGSTSGLTDAQRRIVAARRRRRRATAWVTPLAAAAAAVTWFAWPGHPGTGGGSGAAFASWTAVPAPLDPTTRAAADGACHDSLRATISGGDDGGHPPTTDPTAMRTVLAERRGGVLLVQLAGPDGSDWRCYLDAASPGDVVATGGGLSTDEAAPPAPLGPAQIDVPGGGSFTQGARTFASVSGRVGSAVRAVTVHGAGQDVTATVSGGYMAAWWPAHELPVNAPDPIVTYDVTLADGRVLRDATNLGYSPDRPGPRQVTGVNHGGGTDSVTIGGRVGRDVVAVVVHTGARTARATVVDGVFGVELPQGTDTSQARFDLTLKDGTVLRDQQPVSH